jgi:RimJ/RimL family protein N-acetyltransferase
MTTATTTGRSTTYEFRLDGHLDDHWASWLDGLSLVRSDDGTTVLTGPLADQSGLHGLLSRIRDLGAPLLSLRAVDDAAPGASSTAPTAAHPSRAVDDPARGAESTAPTAAMLRQPLRTERLMLRPATADDAGATWSYRRLDSVGAWLTEVPTDFASYRSTFADPERLAATVIVALDGHVIGDFMLRVDDAWAQAEVADEAKGAVAELGWVLDPAYTGQGFTTEAVRALVEYCFARLGVRRVVANCFLANDASWRLMERIGMRREGHAVAESLHRSGQWLDTVTYAILAEEWPS